MEEDLFRLSPFINDNPPLPPLSPLAPADAPILICSLPNEQSPPPPPPPPPPPQETNNNKGESSSKQTAATTSTKTKNKKDKKKDGKRRRLMGAQLRTSSRDADGQEEPTQPPPEPEVAPPPVTTTRKLPESILKPNADRRDASGQYSKEEATDVAPTESVHKPPCDLVVTLEDVVRKYSRRPDTTYDHMSLLEISEMKGFFDRTS